MQCNALPCPALHCTALLCTALHCTALHCTALHCTALHCNAIHNNLKLCLQNITFTIPTYIAYNALVSKTFAYLTVLLRSVAKCKYLNISLS